MKYVNLPKCKTWHQNISKWYYDLPRDILRVCCHQDFAEFGWEFLHADRDFDSQFSICLGHLSGCASQVLRVCFQPVATATARVHAQVEAAGARPTLPPLFHHFIFLYVIIVVHTLVCDHRNRHCSETWDSEDNKASHYLTWIKIRTKGLHATWRHWSKGRHVGYKNEIMYFMKLL